MSDHHIIKEVHKVKPADKVSLGTKLSWGMGGIADNYIMNALNILVLPIYNIAFHMDPVLLGIALFIPRFLDAITDPLMGNISDNTRSRWGRRRPYIFVGAILSALLLPFIWTPPSQTQTGLFIYFAIISICYMSIAYTMYIVPYTALGYELTNDYDERTRTLSWRMYLGIIGGISMPWLYKLCLLPVFKGDAAAGAFWLSVIIGVIIVITGILPAIKGKENVQAAKQDKIKMLDALKYTMKNRPFQILVVGYIFVIFTLFTCGTVGLYVSIYYVGKGAKDIAATKFVDESAIVQKDYFSQNLGGISAMQVVASQILEDTQAQREAFAIAKKTDDTVAGAVEILVGRELQAKNFIDATSGNEVVATYNFDESYVSTLLEKLSDAPVAISQENTSKLVAEFDLERLTLKQRIQSWFMIKPEIIDREGEEFVNAKLELTNLLDVANADLEELNNAMSLEGQVINFADLQDLLATAYQAKKSFVSLDHWFMNNELIGSKIDEVKIFNSYIADGIQKCDFIANALVDISSESLKTYDGLLGASEAASDYYKKIDARSFSATIGGLAGTVVFGTSYLSMFLITAISVRWGKRHGMVIGLILALAGTIMQIYTFNPSHPYWLLISSFVMGLGLQGCWLMISSMVGDVCDVDELETGLRREGVYGAVTGFAMKFAISLTALAGGILLVAAGFDSKVAGYFGNISPDVLFKLKYYFIGLQALGLIITIIVFMFYPITRAKAEEIRRLLDERKTNAA